MSNDLYIEVIRRSRVIDVGERRISRVVREFRGRSRFVIYLPTTRNGVWEILWSRRVPIKVFIEIPEGAIKDLEDRGGDRG